MILSQLKNKKIFLFIFFTAVVTVALILQQFEFNNIKSTKPISSNLRTRPQQLIHLMELISEHIKADRLSKTEINDIKSFIEKFIENKKKINQSFDKESNKVQDVCPEIYTPGSSQSPNFLHSYTIEKCKNIKKLDQIITILILIKSPSDYVQKSYEFVMNGIAETYPNVQVLIGLNESGINSTKKFKNTKYVQINDNENYGAALNKLIKRINTKYVLISRELFHFHWFANLERQIRVLSKDDSLVAVGGAFRKSNAFWSNGCYQMKTKMRSLRFIQGYYDSRKECLYCDMLQGPFVAKSNYLKSSKFDETFKSRELTFIDWFLKIKENRYGAMNCPDVMYFMSDEHRLKELSTSKSWLPLAKKWKFDYILPDHNTTYKYSCKEISYKCDMMTTKSFLLPTCCFDEMANPLKFWSEFADKHNITWELTAGSVLGAVKLGDMMPWDLDGDLHVQALKFEFIRKHQNEFNKRNFNVRTWDMPTYSKDGVALTGRFLMNSPLYYEMYAESRMSYEDHLPKRFNMVSTKISVHGVTANVPLNPGLYARSRYGVECYKHSQSWIIHGKNSSWLPYEAGVFTKCSKPNFHACLDGYPIDGSIPFKIFN